MTVTTDPQQFQRAVRGLPFTASYTFGLDDDALPGTAATVTVTIVDAEGDTVVNAASATLGAITSGQQTASLALDADLLPSLDLLTATWSVNDDDYNVVSLIDVCGRRLFPISDYALYPEIAAANRGAGFSTVQLEDQRLAAEAFLERECGAAFTPRYGAEHRVLEQSGRRLGTWGPMTAYGPEQRARGYGKLSLRQPHVTLLRSITRNYADGAGEPQTYSVNLAWATLDERNSALYYASGRSASQHDGLWGDLTIAYEHGKWLADVRRICSQLARYRLLQGPLDARATQLSVEGGGVVNLLTPGLQGSVTGIAEVDVFIARYNERAQSFVSGL